MSYKKSDGQIHFTRKGFSVGSLIFEVLMLFPLSSKTNPALALFLSGNICCQCFRRKETTALKTGNCTPQKSPERPVLSLIFLSPRVRFCKMEIQSPLPLLGLSIHTFNQK